MRVGITGHQRLESHLDWEWVEREFSALLHSLKPPLIGVTCLAIGADQLFANAILQNGGIVEAVIPFQEYEMSFEADGKEQYYKLIKRAAKITTLQRKASIEESYSEAGKVVVDSSEIIIGVWNGLPAAGLGGTADVIRYALQKGKTVTQLNPTHQIVKQLEAAN